MRFGRSRLTARQCGWAVPRCELLVVLSVALLAAILPARGDAKGGPPPKSQSRGKSSPTLTRPPTISGSRVVGQKLAASSGTWSGPGIRYGYQWLHCDTSGSGCTSVAGGTYASFSLIAADVGYTMRVRVTASNRNGSAMATSSPTAVVVSAASAPSKSTASYPASFFSGPAGTHNILPPKAGAFLGVWPGKSETFTHQTQEILNEEAYFGRKLDIYHIHYGAPDEGCYYGTGSTYTVPVASGKEAWAVNRGMVPLVSWTPGYYVDEIIAGKADACLRDVASRYAAWGKRFMLRMYWEFNGTWFKWSKNSDGSIATASEQQAMWRHTVDVMRGAGMTNASWVWAPDEGGYGRSSDIAMASYPGDSYVDWIASDGYNHDNNGWCGNHSGWCSFEDIFHHGYTGSSAIGWEVWARGRKPYMVAETGSVEDPYTPGRKGQWMTDMRDAIKSDFPDLYALVYFNVDFSATGGPNWTLTSSSSSYAGFKALTDDPYFMTQS